MVEKIRKALEKAREQRQSAAPAVSPDPSAGAAAAPAPASRAAHGIVYRETRVIRPSEAQLERQRVVAGLLRHPLADTFRVLRTRVMHRLVADGCSTLAVTSANEGEGKTLIAVNLAVSFALNVARTVLLVDLDLRAPSVHRVFGLESGVGLQDYLTRDAPLSDCLVNPGIERLVVLPAGIASRGSSELLASPRMAQLAEELRQRYPDRIILYDLPPLLVSDDALVFLRHAERCLFVVADGSTPRRDIVRSMELLADCHVLGTVLNKATEPQTSRYDYDYGRKAVGEG